ncbi:MAG: LVIVD repeat-containing protein [Betaproteobacteria bacterium]
MDGVRIAHNLKLLGRHDAGGAPNLGEGMALKLTRDGRRIMYIAHEHAPMAFSIFDVTEPRAPRLVWQLPLPHRNVRGNSLALRGDTLLMAYQVNKAGLKPAGFQVYDVSNPVEPREVSFFDMSGGHSQGVHFVSFMDGRYAHITTGAPDFEPDHPKDHQFYMIVDLANPSKPAEVGRWWMPGQRKGDPARLPPRHPEPFDFAYRPHHTLSYPERPDRAYVGYIDGGIVILDISDKSAPKLISRLDYHPPFPGFTHTVLPLFERDLLVVTDEATGDQGIDWPKRLWMVDARVESNPVMIASMPTPDSFDDLHRIGGRIGAHNIHENEPEPGSAKLQNTVVATWFSAGLRIYDIADPFRPEEIAAFLPETPEGQRGCRISDVFVDDRGVIYAADRARGGLYTLEYTGSHPLN